MLRALLPIACLAATAAAAQTVGPDTRLLLPSGVLRGSPRVMGLAGAYVGIGEGAEGVTRNPAAAASKDPTFPPEPHLDLGFALHFLPPWGVGDQDWDNDGRPDRHPGPVSFLSTQVVYAVASLQFRTFGLAAGFDVQNYMAEEATGGFNLGLFRVFAAAAVSSEDDSILVGAGVESTQALLSYLAERRFQESIYYGGLGLSFGALWRPRDQDYRVGFMLLPQIEGRNFGLPGQIGGLSPFGSVVAPTLLSLGASWALGPGRHYNITDREGWVPLPGRTAPSPALMKWLLTAQLDITLPVSRAIAVAGFLDQQVATPLPAGDRVTFTPRLGVEKELIPDWFRARAGFYLEPPMVASGRLRPHVTLGGEAFLFPLPVLKWPISFGLSFDLARAYQNLSFGFLIWK